MLTIIRDRRSDNEKRPMSNEKDNPEELMAEAVRHHKAGRVDLAHAFYLEYLDIRPDDAGGHHLFGLLALQMGRFDEAAGMFRRAVELDPGLAEADNNLGNALQQTGDAPGALAAFRRAVESDPGLFDAHYNLAGALRARGDREAAERSYRRALEIIPANVPALGNLAALLEGMSRTDEALEVVEKGLKLAPSDPLLNLTAAKLDRRAGRFAAGIERLATILAHPLGPDMETGGRFELGHLYDRAGRADDAYGQFARANRLQRQKSRPQGIDKNRYLAAVGILGGQFTKDWVAGWTTAADCADLTPVFLVGFPRSGTTLLDNILRGHPKITVMEEESPVADMRNAAARLPGGYPECLANLSADDIAGLRRVYFDSAAAHVDLEAIKDGAILADKMPLNIVDAGLIERVFPGARFVLSLRHPADVVLSCFMQAFAVNDPMANFFTLDDAARLYERVMGLWRRYLDILPIACHNIRYEDLVADAEGEIRRVVGFLGLDWRPDMLDFAARARKRGAISTPSYAQVTEPIYTRASGRRRRYAAYLAPVMGRLGPFIGEFGYAEDGE